MISFYLLYCFNFTFSAASRSEPFYDVAPRHSPGWKAEAEKVRGGSVFLEKVDRKRAAWSDVARQRCFTYAGKHSDMNQSLD